MDTWNLYSLRLAVAGSSQNSSDAARMPLPSGEPDLQRSENLPALFKTPQQQLKSFKVEFVTLQSGPYSDINVSLQKALQHGSNTYSTLSTADQDIIYDALKQRCHSSSQLRRHRFVLLGDNYPRHQTSCRDHAPGHLAFPAAKQLRSEATGSGYRL